jgi:hypothetical protein
MIKNVCCSFDNEHGMVYVTCNNGVHPDRNGHHSRTVVMPREHFLKCCKNRELFNEPLGIDVRLGWQNAIKNATSNCLGLKLEMEAEQAAKDIIEVNVAQRGEEAVKADIDALAENNEAVQNELKTIIEKEVKEDEAKPKKTRASKGSKKSRGADVDTTPDGESTGSDSESK